MLKFTVVPLLLLLLKVIVLLVCLNKLASASTTSKENPKQPNSGNLPVRRSM